MTTVNSKFPSYLSVKFRGFEFVIDKDTERVNLSKLLNQIGSKSNYKELMRTVERLIVIDDFSEFYYGKPGVRLAYLEGTESRMFKPSEFKEVSSRTDEQLFDKKKRARQSTIKFINTELFDDREAIPKDLRGIYVPYQIIPMFIIWVDDSQLLAALRFEGFIEHDVLEKEGYVSEYAERAPKIDVEKLITRVSDMIRKELK